MAARTRYSGAPSVARTPRCLHPELHVGEISLDRDATHHLGRVLRLNDGEAVELVDGRGGLAHGSWLGGGRVEVSRVDPAVVPRARRVLAVAPPRPSRLDWLTEKAAELGIHRLQLLDCAHVARPVSENRVARLQRKAGEALLQCRRLHLMQVAPSRSLTEVLDEARGGDVWLAAPPPAEGPPAPPARDLLVLVGPEGGFDAAERELALGRGAREVALGHGVLRVETAALAMAVLAGEG